jgi:hypothetical protein
VMRLNKFFLITKNRGRLRFMGIRMAPRL